MGDTIRVTVWNEYRHEKQNESIGNLYPDGMHGAIAKHLAAQPGLEVGTATLDEPEHGLTEEVLNNTDVLTWWGHIAHAQVKDEIAARVKERVLAGMGLIVLHSGHMSKIFSSLMGIPCNLKWREVGEKERLWCVSQGHPIAEGLGVHKLVRGRRGVSERVLLPPRQRKDILLPPRSRNVSDLLRQERAARDNQRRALGQARRRPRAELRQSRAPRGHQARRVGAKRNRVRDRRRSGLSLRFLRCYRYAPVHPLSIEVRVEVEIISVLRHEADHCEVRVAGSLEIPGDYGEFLPELALLFD